MKIEEIGEFGLINHIVAPFLKNLPPEVIKGIGDDCAVIMQTSSSLQLVTTDMLIEGIHFLAQSITPEDLGHKALATNLSDIAAMGGKPTSSFLSLALPLGYDLEWVDRFYEGYGQISRHFQVPLLGGNTSRSPNPLIINVCVLGTVSPENVKFRSSAKSGDIVCVTGNLGDSMGGLKLILEASKNLNDFENHLIKAHLLPQPHIEEGLWLGAIPDVHAMIDISDGLASDLMRLSESSQVGFCINLDSLPLSEALLKTCQSHQWDPYELGAVGGEDYCLLLTVKAEAYPWINDHFQSHFQHPLWSIGTVLEKHAGISFKINGRSVNLAAHEFDHFKNP